MNESEFYKNDKAYYQKPFYYVQKRNEEKSSILISGVALGATLIISLILQTVAVALISPLGLHNLFYSSAIFQHSANIIISDFIGLIIPFGLLSLIFKKRFVAPVIPHREIGKLKCAAWVGIGMGVCIGANYLTNYVKDIFKVFGYELHQSEFLKPDSIFACIVIVFSTAIAPAICEEFAFRCCSLGMLRSHGKAFAVVTVSILFGLLHGNIIQFVFAFTIGLVLGYITVTTDSVIPAMLIHGFNNGMSVTRDIIEYAAGKKAGNNALLFLFIMWVVMFVLGLIYLAATRSLLPKRTEKETSFLSFGQKLLWLLPGLIVPIIVLVFLGARSIQPIS